MIRKARVEDVKAVHGLIGSFADSRVMLPRSLSELYDNVRDFWVAESDGEIVGACACHVVWEDLAEVKSLAVRADWQGRGLGREFVDKAKAEARALGVRRLFCLTFRREFFERMGFEPIPKEELPHKIWAECIKCPMFPDCGEVALIMTL
jgi:amino-acid N-acetyltransferase